MTSALTKNPKEPLFSRLFSGGREAQLQVEKARLEAFLNAFPGDYCGFSHDGSVAYSRGFCGLLGLEFIHNLTDIENRLSPGDAAALEGLMNRLNKNGIPFTLLAESVDAKKCFKITGTEGRDLKNEDRYSVLWIEDITEVTEKQQNYSEQKQTSDEELTQVQTALNSIPRPLWLRDMQQNIIWCNETYAAFLNTNPEDAVRDQKEIAAQTKGGKTAKNSVEMGKNLAAKALHENKVMEKTAHIVHNRRRHYMRISETPLHALNMTLGIAYDITREEELETELRRYQASSKGLLEHLRSAIAIFGPEEHLEFYNSAYSQLWGLEEKWLNTKPRLGEIMEKLRETRRLPEQADFKKFKQSWIGMISRLIESHEDMLHLPDGSALRMLVVPHALGGIMMTFEDVTSRLELESSYNTLIAVQKETLDNLAEAVSVFGGDGRLKLWNPAFAQLWGLNPEDLEGEPHITSLAEKLKSYFSEHEWPQKKKKFIADGLERRMHEGRIDRSDDTYLEYTTVPLPDGGVLVTYSDVTDTVMIENALRDRNAALEAAEQLKLDFLANVSYQLRTPLNAIMGFNEILDKEYFGPLNEKQKEYTRDTHEASKRLLDLINDILDLSTLEAGYLRLDLEEMKILPMMEGVAELVNEWARKEKIEVTLKCPANIGAITADRRRLQQALINLVRNAIAFTPEKGKIEISASRKKDAVHISVSDTGIGISQKDRMRIFEPFERAHSGSKNPRLSKTGAGLGLSLVKNIVALHSGEVVLESEPGEGTIVTLILPFTSQKTNLKLGSK